MKRRDFLRALTGPFFTVAGLGILGAGSKTAWGDDELDYVRGLKIWSYYVPLTSYSGILEEFEGKNPLDQKVIFDQVIKKTNRISGKETDGTKNPATFEIDQLQNASADFIRVKFWHDDNGRPTNNGHKLHIFKRYLEDLENGKKVFVATGMYQGHFHVVMIQPPA